MPYWLDRWDEILGWRGQVLSISAAKNRTEPFINLPNLWLWLSSSRLILLILVVFFIFRLCVMIHNNAVTSLCRPHPCLDFFARYYRQFLRSWGLEKRKRFSSSDRKTIWESAADDRARYHPCVQCHAELPFKSGWHVDHVIPWSLGGSNALWNLQALCKTCNIRKSDKSQTEMDTGVRKKEENKSYNCISNSSLDGCNCIGTVRIPVLFLFRLHAYDIVEVKLSKVNSMYRIEIRKRRRHRKKKSSYHYSNSAPQKQRWYGS